jgi:hypothetical protein
MPFLWNGINRTTAGTYTFTTTNSQGCDSTATLNLTVKTNTTSTTNVSICPSQLPYNWNGSRAVAGTYTFTTTNSQGCDSTATLNLTVKTNTTSTTNVSICPSALPYSWNGSRAIAGTYTFTTTNSQGCDSTATLNLTVKTNTTSTTNVSICPSALPYSWNGSRVTAGTYTFTTTNSQGCDSTATLNLTVKTNTTSTTNVSICPSALPYSWNGSRTVAGTYTFTTTNSQGCDSTATLNLTVKTNTTSTTAVSRCPSQMPFLWNGINRTTAGTYTFTTTNSQGCDSITILNLTVKTNTTSTTNVSICPSQLPYSWNGSRTLAGTYTYTTMNIQGCDSVAILNLTVTSLTPSLSISTATTSICSGSNTTFTANATNGGPSPNYQWKKNGVDAGSGSTITFLSNTLSNNDVISCVLTANNICQTTATANSNAIQMTVKQSPSVAQISNGISTITSATLCTLGSSYNYYCATGFGTWSSSNPGVASVAGRSLAAVVTANTNGTATISYNVAAANGCVSTSSILLTLAQQAAPTAISGTNSICVNATTALSSTAPDGTTGVWSSSNNRGIISIGGVYTGQNAGTGEARYTVTNTVTGCKAFAAYAITINLTPVIPTIAYAPGQPNPQLGAPAGSFCVGKKFRVTATPNVPLGVWSTTGVPSLLGLDTISINGVGAGTIKYTYTSAAGCSNSRTLSGNGFTCASRGVNTVDGQLSTVNGFAMYPNPAKGLINLNVETLIGAGSIIVTDLYGKSVKTQNLSMGTNTVNISNLSKGMYFVSTITNEGKTTKKLVVE